MKKTLIAALVMSSASFAYADDHAVKLDSKEQRLGYSIGTMFGSRMSQDFSDLDMKTFMAGFQDAFASKEGKMSMEEVNKTIQDYQQEQMAKAEREQAKMVEESKAASATWLKEKEAEDGVKKTESGLLYKVINSGEGDKPQANDTVEVDYEGSLIDGTVFDSSYERGESISFPLNGVIPGWTEGLQLMPAGSKYELYIPAELAYGPGGTGPIPPNAALKFVVELHKVVNEEKAAE
ncbi:FKBP-type peptidyl-prolyl cis-trans isomerase [Marinomonas sp. M1K-6]|uniref:Peptidyl-prolyl cis-trans isomerase n=1 Tax=Marinomonas profundi TaxID=2726122 RepID=A0A847R441_9GAMM|nr:FKBP-type peptidyl-prolyl cis-trans isomerase [Marinomonas profundi]NLQ18741.1 FKBP-type peptidyl-prolyl cis-trans isomerase [Marinomonas profundi]UDV04013.1 FKBP-type peptidyl-prolyl cis-trans isomerase [Marinomonas profundi]